jgi:hypothetical protein
MQTKLASAITTQLVLPDEDIPDDDIPDDERITIINDECTNPFIHTELNSH